MKKVLDPKEWKYGARENNIIWNYDKHEFIKL